LKLGLAIHEVADAEETLGQRLNALGERHKADHDVFHLTETLQRIARANLERLAPHADRYDVELDPSSVQEGHGTGLLEKAREKTSEVVGRRPEPGLLLIRDLRELHLSYAEASINYVILSQGAKAARDGQLVETCSQCHAQTLRGMKWTVTRLKTASPQVLTG
jgi:cytochrome c2